DATPDVSATRDASPDQSTRPVVETSNEVSARDVRIVADDPRLENGTDVACDGPGCQSCQANVPCTPINACHTELTACSLAPACIDTGTSIPDGVACGSTASCQGGRCTCGSANGTTQPFASCSNSTSCQPGFVCVDSNGDGVFSCKPVCS